MTRVALMICLLISSLSRPACAQVVELSEYSPFQWQIVSAADLRWIRESSGLPRTSFESARELIEGTRGQSRLLRLRVERRAEMFEQGTDGTPMPKAEVRRAEEQTRREYFESRLRLERELLADLQLVFGSDNEEAWRGFLRQRAIRGAWSEWNIPWPTLDDVLARFKPTPEELTLIADARQRCDEALYRVVEEVLPAGREVERARRTESDDDNAALGPAISRIQSVTRRVRDPIQTAVREIAGLLPPPRGQRWATMYEDAEILVVLQLPQVENDDFVRRILRISTLTEGQKREIREFVRNVDRERVEASRAAASVRISALLGDSSASERDETEADRANDVRRKIRQGLRAKIMAMLTPEQREAYIEGVEPPARSRSGADDIGDDIGDDFGDDESEFGESDADR
jgi:hypothetical protein